MPSKSRLIEFKVSEFSKEGKGMGEWLSPEGRSYRVEVPFSVPGDEGLLELVKKRHKTYQGRFLEWSHLSSERIAPLCQHFGSCGGCQWQHLAYKDQLKQKEDWIYHFFEPYLRSEAVLHPIIPCDPPWQYRNKMELSFSSDKAGRRYLGLILYGTRGHVFQMKECHLTHSWVAEAVQVVSKWWEDSELDAYHLGSNKGSLRTLTLREGQRTGDRMVVLTVSGDPHYALNQKQLQTFVSVVRGAIEPSLTHQKLSIFLRIQQIAKGKPTQFYEMLLYGPDHIREILSIEIEKGNYHSLEFHISPSAFFQPNTRQAEKLYSRAIQLTRIPKDALIYDLYCGTGTLGICMAKQAREVIGIELSPESALDARENAKRNQLSNVFIHTGDVGRLLPNFLNNEKSPEVVLVDPPRAGLDTKALENLLKIKAPQLTYISCNPKTQAANIEILTQGGYRVKAIQPVDQFPQTIHVENIVICEC